MDLIEGERRMATGRRRFRPVLYPILGLLLIAVVALGISVGSYFVRSDGEPPQVVVATWMRDHHMEWLVAQAEDIYFTYINVAEVGGDPEISAQFPSAEPDDVDAEVTTVTTESGVEPTADASPSEVAASETAPAVREHLNPPDPIMSPVIDPEPSEGEWQPVASKVDKIPAIYVTRVRTDDIHTKYYATAMWIDTKLTRIMFIPGYQEPGGPNPFNGALPEDQWPYVLANFNGGFRINDSRGGYFYDGVTVKPLVSGRASAVVLRDGTMQVGKWPRNFKEYVDAGGNPTPEVMAVRQNLDLIVDKGQSQVASANDNLIWGATTDKGSMTWRAAVGERPDGSLVYVVGEYLSATGLADTLVGAGVQRAMVLDMNQWWAAAFYFNHKKSGAIKCHPLEPAISGDCMRFLNDYKRDSFQVLAN
ncbi:MAG: hypothetical protein K9G05_02705 [Candidatus Nanopelagicales bacterium]|nr:hypothetical protein [Candidatus Nanopelagicales bacterium]MCF8539269.1 hypothetical protein [Candidatus Nanopelagicales bacterium]MCF8550975.1 hypothetical protein [Candidatus Nanopelagicales bacterium]